MHDQHHRARKLGAILALALLGFGIVVVAVGIGGAATAELANETVEPTNDSAVEVSIAWNDSIADPATESATVEFYNATEYDADPSTATLVLDDEIDASEGNTTTVEYNVSDTALEDGTSYRLIVTANDSAVDDVDVGTTGDDGGFWAPIEGNQGNAAVLGILAVIAVGVYVRRDS